MPFAAFFLFEKIARAPVFGLLFPKGSGIVYGKNTAPRGDVLLRHLRANLSPARPSGRGKKYVMLQIIEKVCIIMLVLFAFAIPGFALRKSNLVRPESMYSLANILLYLCQPMLTVKAFAIDPLPPTGEVLLNFLYVFLLSLAAVMLTFGASKLVFHYMKAPEERRARDVLVFIGTFSNCAFVGIPFIDMFTGGNSEAMMYIIVFTAAFNLILWTLGAYLITQDKSQISVRKALLNPCTIGAAIGLLLFCGAVLINVLTGSMTIDGISSGFSPVLFLLFLLGFGVQGMGEEVLCRGYFMVSLGRRYRAAAAVFLNSAVFSLLHIFNPGISLLAIVNLLLAGVVFSLYFLRTGNIWGAGAMHTVWNFVQGNVFGMEVSGLEISCSLFSSTSDPSRSLWNGGSFGAEGGLSVTIVLTIAILVMLFTARGNAAVSPRTENAGDNC